MAGTFNPTGASDLAFVDRGLDRALRRQQMQQDALAQDFARGLAERQFEFTQGRAARADMESDRGFDFASDQAAREQAFRNLRFDAERSDADRSFGLAQDRMGLDELSVGDSLKSSALNRQLSMNADERAAMEARQMADKRAMDQALSKIQLDEAQKNQPLNDQIRAEGLASSKQRVKEIMAALPPAEAAKRDAALRVFAQRTMPVASALGSASRIATKSPALATALGELTGRMAQLGEDIAAGRITTADAEAQAKIVEARFAELAAENPDLGDLLDESMLTRAQERGEAVKDRKALGAVDAEFEKKAAKLSAQLGMDKFELNQMIEAISKGAMRQRVVDGKVVEDFNADEVGKQVAELVMQARGRVSRRFE